MVFFLEEFPGIIQAVPVMGVTRGPGELCGPRDLCSTLIFFVETFLVLNGVMVSTWSTNRKVILVGSNSHSVLFFFLVKKKKIPLHQGCIQRQST